MAKKFEVKFDDGKWVDNLGRNIIVDRLTNSMYIVPNSESKRYKIMRGRLAFVFALAMAAGAFVSLLVGAITLVVSFLIAEVVYRVTYLPKLQKVKDEKLPDKPTLLERYKMDNDGTLIAMFLLSVVLIVLLPIYIKQEVADINLALTFKDLNGAIIVYGSVVIIVLAVYLIYSTIATLIKRRHK